MNNFGIKYFIILALVVGMFSQAVACGTQMYLVSVKEDFDGHKSKNTEIANPQAAMYGIHSTEGWGQLPIKVSFGDSLSETQQSELAKAMAQWEWAIGKKIFEIDGVENGVDGDTFKDLYSSLNDEINGQYFDNNWKKTSKPSHVLATTIWNNGSNDSNMITKADIRFNSEFYTLEDSLINAGKGDKEIVDLQSLALHELGHLLGLAHIDASVDKYSVMNPALFIGEGLTTRELSKGDILRIQKIYGCEGEACDIDKLLTTQKQILNAEIKKAATVRNSRAAQKGIANAPSTSNASQGGATSVKPTAH